MECVSYDSSRLLYDRIRILSIDCKGFISCSCGKVHICVTQCRHICAIISRKSCMYLKCLIFAGTSCSIIIMTTILATHFTATINNIICWTRDNCFPESDSYKRVYVKDSLFYK